MDLSVEESDAADILAEFGDSFAGDELESLLAEEEREPAATSSFVKIARCRRCHHELYIGNMFCTECGARIEP